MTDQGNQMGDAGGNRYLSFTLGEEDYAIPLLSVKEVIAVPEITPIPFSPPHFLGIMNLRGQVISVIDLRQKFQIKTQKSSETAIIICDVESLCLGVVVDSINSVLAPSADEISNRPEMQSQRNTDYITHVCRRDKKLILFLDVAKTLGVGDMQVAARNSKTQQAA